MPRRPRHAAGGFAYHVLNRAVRRATIFKKEADYEAFERVLAEAWERTGMRIISYCIMPNHWHLVLWPKADGDLSEFMRWLTVTHTQRWHAHHGTSGTGPLYQGRYKSFPIKQDHHFLTVCRYIERNALRAGLVENAEDWRWCSLATRRRRSVQDRAFLAATGHWPVPPPRNWVQNVNRRDDESELSALRASTQRGTPFGDAQWQEHTAEKLGLTSSLNPPGRPKKRIDSTD